MTNAKTALRFCKGSNKKAPKGAFLLLRLRVYNGVVAYATRHAAVRLEISLRLVLASGNAVLIIGAAREGLGVTRLRASAKVKDGAGTRNVTD